MQRLKQLYIYILIFTCIYIEFGYAVVVANQISGTLRSVILLFVATPLLFFKPLHSNKSVMLLLISVVIIVVNSIRDNAIGDYFLLILPILIGFLIATRISINCCVKCFCNLIYYLSIYSIALFLICYAFPAVASSLPLIGNFYDSSATIHNGLLSVVIYGADLPRNFGITWEPGAFAVLLCMATFCTIHCYNRVNKRRVFIYSIGILTTFSTMGYIVLLLIFISSLKSQTKGTGILIPACLIVIIALQIPFMQELVFGKLTNLNSSTGNVSETTEARINAIIFPGAAFLEHPIFGVGYKEFRFINSNLCDNVATNTIINWFAIFGIILGLPFLSYYIYSICKFLPSRTPILFTILISIGAIFLVSTESLLRISLIYVIIFWGTLNRSSKELING